VARDPGLNIFGVHRGHHPEMARMLEEELRTMGRKAVLHVADAGHADGAHTCAEAFRAVAGAQSVGLLVHSISGASLGHFLSTRNDAFHPRQFEKTFNYLAHSFAYWAQTLYERDLLAPGARLLGLTNSLHDSLLHNCGLIAAAKAASVLMREETAWFNGATIDFTGGMTLRLLDLVLRPD
jgi:enoyl-[acyl-carrier-protein] reductase (NADH)